ncbi:hypothetical protein V6N13_120946 [Hibiscus sabdariffa]
MGSVVRTVVGAFLDALVRFLGFGFGSIAIDDELGNGTWLELDEGSNKVGGFKNAGTESRNEPNSLSPPPLEDCILLLFYQNLRGKKRKRKSCRGNRGNCNKEEKGFSLGSLGKQKERNERRGEAFKEDSRCWMEWTGQNQTRKGRSWLLNIVVDVKARKGCGKVKSNL